MNIVVANLWSSTAEYILITTNSIIKHNGELVMGRGAAIEAKTRYPNIALELGTLINHRRLYGIIMTKPVGAFQVKYNWADPARLDIITYSAECLAQWCEDNPNATIAMNFPGIGNGRLSHNEVEPILAILPEQVSIHIRS